MANHVSFRNPPVVETVLGVQFNAIHGLTNGHLGAFWSSLGKDWPNAEDAAALEEQREFFDTKASWHSDQLRLFITQKPSARLRIRNADGDRMVQVQNCRIDYNWLGHEGHPYPRYVEVKPEFEEKLRVWADFIEGHGFDKPKTNQWEITYVNHMPKGTVWERPADWCEMFRGLPGPTTVGSLCLEGLEGSWHFEIEPARGRLHVQLKYGYKVDEPEKELLIAKLTARGPLSGDINSGEIQKGLDLGHQTIVSAFAEMTSETAQEHWERE